MGTQGCNWKPDAWMDPCPLQLFNRAAGHYWSPFLAVESGQPPFPQAPHLGGEGTEWRICPSHALHFTGKCRRGGLPESSEDRLMCLKTEVILELER